MDKIGGAENLPRVCEPAGFDEVGPIELVLLRGPHEAFRDEETVAAQWRSLNYPAAPELDAAIREFEQFVEAIEHAGARVIVLPGVEGLSLDAIYVRDAAVVVPGGMVLGSMGKAAREGEPGAAESAFRSLGIPVRGWIREPGRLEGGDLVWLDERTLVVGEGYRTNREGIGQLAQLVGPEIHLEVVPLPHWHGPDDVFHLMSVLSPIDRDLALVYSPLMPVPFRQWLLSRGITLVEVPHDEFESMGGNVLALAPRRCLMLSGNPGTRAALEAHGAHVHEYEGREISAKGAGGPTCLTRPVRRG